MFDPDLDLDVGTSNKSKFWRLRNEARLPFQPSRSSGTRSAHDPVDPADPADARRKKDA